jgi:hypothetical protein
MNCPRTRALSTLTRADSDHGAMAQQVAHLLCKQGVRGSSPLGSTYFPLSKPLSALLGDLNQSTCSSKLQQLAASS